MEGNVFDCSLNYDPNVVDKEYVFVPFSELFDYKNKTLSFELDYMLIQRLRKIRSYDTVSDLPNLEDNEVILIKKYIKKYRPDETWESIAEMLGISKKTLWVKRDKYGLE